MLKVKALKALTFDAMFKEPAIVKGAGQQALCESMIGACNAVICQCTNALDPV